LHRVAKISMCFQGLPFAVGNSTQHECNMERSIWRADGAARKATVVYRMP
jgi:hypothetical protein